MMLFFKYSCCCLKIQPHGYFKMSHLRQVGSNVSHHAESRGGNLKVGIVFLFSQIIQLFSQPNMKGKIDLVQPNIGSQKKSKSSDFYFVGRSTSCQSHGRWSLTKSFFTITIVSMHNTVERYFHFFRFKTLAVSRFQPQTIESQLPLASQLIWVDVLVIGNDHSPKFKTHS